MEIHLIVKICKPIDQGMDDLLMSRDNKLMIPLIIIMYVTYNTCTLFYYKLFHEHVDSVTKLADLFC